MKLKYLIWDGVTMGPLLPMININSLKVYRDQLKVTIRWDSINQMTSCLMMTRYSLSISTKSRKIKGKDGLISIFLVLFLLFLEDLSLHPFLVVIFIFTVFFFNYLDLLYLSWNFSKITSLIVRVIGKTCVHSTVFISHL